MIPSDDEELALRASLVSTSIANTAALTSKQLQHRVEVGGGDHAVSWRVLKPRMALAVLTVSLQHIAAHSKSRTAVADGQEEHHTETNRSNKSNSNNTNGSTSNSGSNSIPPTKQERRAPPRRMCHPAIAGGIRTISLDEGIEPDR